LEKQYARVFVPEHRRNPHGGPMRGPLLVLWCVPGLLQNQHPPHGGPMRGHYPFCGACRDFFRTSTSPVARCAVT
jgi:hypothetical protein